MKNVLEGSEKFAGALGILTKIKKARKGSGEEQDSTEDDTTNEFAGITSNIDLIESEHSLEDEKEQASDKTLDKQPIEKADFKIIPTVDVPKSKTPKASSEESAKLETTTDQQEKTSIQNQKKEVPALPYSDKVWSLPPLELLDDPPKIEIDRGDVTQRAKIIEETLDSFGITAKSKRYTVWSICNSVCTRIRIRY